MPLQEISERVSKQGVKIVNLEKRADRNDEAHKDLQGACDSLRDRLPLWAVWCMSLLSGLVGAMAGALIKGMTI
jgi:hypothetical protein